MVKYLLAIIALCSVAMAEEGPYFFGETDVIGQRFVLDKLNGEKFSAPREVFIEFPERGKIAGRICNVFHGECTIERYILTADIASSRMLCPDPQLRQFENDFFKFMRAGIGFMRFGDTLEFRRDNVHAEFRLAGAQSDEHPAAPAGIVRPVAPPAPAPVKPEAAPQISVKPESAPAGEISLKDLEGKKFILEKADGEEFKIKMGQQPFIQFVQDMKVHGRACNVFTGKGKLENGKLYMKNAASTMMMCVDPVVMNYERDFHKLLESGATIAIEGDDLTLSGNGHTYLYKRER